MRERHRVAVLVFGVVEGNDERDAESGLMLAVRQALAGETMGMPVAVPGRGASGPFVVEVHDVTGLGWASDGYIKLVPTTKAYR